LSFSNPERDFSLSFLDATQSGGGAPKDKREISPFAIHVGIHERGCWKMNTHEYGRMKRAKKCVVKLLKI